MPPSFSQKKKKSFSLFGSKLPENNELFLFQSVGKYQGNSYEFKTRHFTCCRSFQTVSGIEDNS